MTALKSPARNIKLYGVSKQTRLFQPHDTCRSVKRIPKTRLRKDSPLLPQSKCSAPEYLCWSLTITETAETQSFQCWAKKWGLLPQNMNWGKLSCLKLLASNSTGTSIPAAWANMQAPRTTAVVQAEDSRGRSKEFFAVPIDLRNFQGVQLT